MSRVWLAALGLGAITVWADVSMAQTVKAKWGLENTWSYQEDQAFDYGRDNRPKANSPRYRYFKFLGGRAEVREPWLACLKSIMKLWDTYKSGSPASEARSTDTAGREQFLKHIARTDPVCLGQLRKTSPRLYFDFATDTSEQFILERVEVATIDFVEYRGGGFAEKEAWTDIWLSPLRGKKSYAPEPRLLFKEHGRLTLRLWSDNFKPKNGWIAPMGEYTIEIRFVFSTAGKKEVTVSTGPFKIDV